MKTILGVIPARLDSTRLKRKALLRIAGHPMIVWVYRRARLANAFSRLLVATDAEEIRACCAEYEIPVVMTSPAHRSGTERLIEVMGREPADIYVNIQGDEPMIAPSQIELLTAPFKEAQTQVTTLAVEISLEEARNPNNVKVVTASRRSRTFQSALYFSRSLIPFDRDGAGPGRSSLHYLKHLGLYAYRRHALEQFKTFSPSKLELAEKLEQLRFLENGIPITVVETQEDSVGVDEEADVAKVEKIFRRDKVTLPS